MRIHWTGSLVCLVCTLSIGGPGLPAASGSAAVADAGRVRVEAGGAVEMPLELAAGDYFEVEVEQIEGDLTLELIDPSGRVAAQSDLPGKPWLSELLAAVTDVGGTYRLRLSAGPSGVTAAESARLVRAAEPRDAALVAALALRAEARRRREGESRDDLTAAAGLYREAVARLEDGGDRRWLGRLLRELGSCQQRSGESAAAEESLLRAIALLRQNGDDAQLAEALNDYGVLRLDRDERQAAGELFSEGLALAERLGLARLEALSWNNLGVYHYHRGEMDEVLAAFERSLAIGAAAGRFDGRANTLANLGAAYRAVGRYADALRLADEALALARRQGDESQEMRVLNNRGVLLKGLGDLRAAIDDYQAALASAERLGDVRWQASIGGNLGAIYRVLGHRRRAATYLTAALSAAAAAESTSDEVWISLTLGELAREQGAAEAEPYFRRAQERSDATANLAGQAYSRYGLGRLRQDVGDSSGSAAALESALAILEEISDRPGQVAVHRELARALAARGDAVGAEAHFSQAIALARRVGDPAQEAAARARHAEFFVERGDLEAARAEVGAALETIESLRQGVVEPDLRAGLLSRSQRDYTLLIDILETLDRRFPRHGHAAQAFAVAERARARSLVELLAESEADLVGGLPPELRRRRRDAAGRLSAAQRALTRAVSRQTYDDAEVERLAAEVQARNLEREAVDREIRSADPRWERVRYPRPLEASQAQELLGPGQVLLTFVLGERGSFVFALTSTELAFERLAGEAELLPLIEGLRDGLARPGRRALGPLRAASRTLYARLLAPVETLLGDRSELLISPDGALHYLPFEVLVDPVSDQYLVSRWAVSYLPSASTLAQLRQRRPRAANGDFDLAAFADPPLPAASLAPGGVGEGDALTWRRLSYAREEVQSIAALFEPSRVEVSIGEEASEARFRGSPAVRRARFVHLASHALIDGDEPALSAVLMSRQAEGDDGLLQAHEVFELELGADLVVLSGCETALGREVRGEGLLGLPRAFLYAGAAAVTVSLWPVEDRSASELMVGFYRELQRGVGTAEALRRAKLARIARPDQAHPYYWAPFVLVGASS